MSTLQHCNILSNVDKVFPKTNECENILAVIRKKSLFNAKDRRNNIQPCRPKASQQNDMLSPTFSQVIILGRNLGISLGCLEEFKTTRNPIDIRQNFSFIDAIWLELPLLQDVSLKTSTKTTYLSWRGPPELCIECHLVIL